MSNNMKSLNRKRVFIAWGKYWAFQAYWYPCISFGIHIDFARLRLDLHLLFFILAIGKDAHITSQIDRHRQTCRGFLFATDPEL